MQRSETSLILHTHIRTFVDKHFGNFIVTSNNCRKHSSLATLILRIHIRTSSQVLHDGLDVPFFYGFVNRDIWCFNFDCQRFWLCNFGDGYNGLCFCC